MASPIVEATTYHKTVRRPSQPKRQETEKSEPPDMKAIHDALTQLTSEIHLAKTEMESLKQGALLSGSDAFEAKVKRAQKWGGWIWGIGSALGLLISGVVAWQVWLGANATDVEVDNAIKRERIRHNGGVDPTAIDPTTFTPVGDHPGMRAAIKENSKSLGEVTKSVEGIEKGQRKIEKLSEYQFARDAWEDEVKQARKERRKPSRELERELNELSRALKLGKYD